MVGAGPSGGPDAAHGRAVVPSALCQSRVGAAPVPAEVTCPVPRQRHCSRLRAHPHPMRQRCGQRAEPQQLQVRVPELRDVPHGHRQEHHAPAGRCPCPRHVGPRGNGGSSCSLPREGRQADAGPSRSVAASRLGPQAPRAVPSAPVRGAWPSPSVPERPQAVVPATPSGRAHPCPTVACWGPHPAPRGLSASWCSAASSAFTPPRWPRELSGGGSLKAGVSRRGLGGSGLCPSDARPLAVLRVHRRLLLQQLHVRPAQPALLVRPGERAAATSVFSPGRAVAGRRARP